MGGDRKGNKQILCGQGDNRRRINSKRGSDDIIPIGEQVYRLKKKVRDRGHVAVIHGNRGRPSSEGKPPIRTSFSVASSTSNI